MVSVLSGPFYHLQVLLLTLGIFTTITVLSFLLHFYWGFPSLICKIKCGKQNTYIQYFAQHRTYTKSLAIFTKFATQEYWLVACLVLLLVIIAV